ncbi:mitochondrial import inner membrane translocase subunit tim23 [Metarhizium brunneum]
MSSLWNAFTGGNKPRQQQHEQTHTFDAPAPSSQTSFDPSQGQGVEAFLQSSTFADPSQLHPLAGLNKDTLEYLTLEDSALSELPGGQSVLPSRGFTDDLCYGTGITYLAALSIGGVWGLQDGLKKSVGQPPKLRMNAILNGMTRRGPFLGNSAGVVAIVYNCINSLIGSLRGKHDSANTVISGFLSGVVFKSTRGVRSMMISGGVVGSVAGVWAIVRRSFFPIPEPAAPIEKL